MGADPAYRRAVDRGRGLEQRGEVVRRLLAATLWVWWVSQEAASSQLQSRTIAHEIIDDSTVQVTFEVSVDTGTPVTCAIEALNPAYGIVGWVQVELPPASAHTTAHRLEVRTSELANTGLVSECWVT